MQRCEGAGLTLADLGGHEPLIREHRLNDLTTPVKQSQGMNSAARASVLELGTISIYLATRSPST